MGKYFDLATAQSQDYSLPVRRSRRPPPPKPAPEPEPEPVRPECAEPKKVLKPCPKQKKAPPPPPPPPPPEPPAPVVEATCVESNRIKSFVAPEELDPFACKPSVAYFKEQRYPYEKICEAVRERMERALKKGNVCQDVKLPLPKPPPPPPPPPLDPCDVWEERKTRVACLNEFKRYWSDLPPDQHPVQKYMKEFEKKYPNIFKKKKTMHVPEPTVETEPSTSTEQ